MFVNLMPMFCLKCAPLLPVGLCICVFLFATEICFCVYGTVSFLNKVHCHLTQTWLPHLVASPKMKWLLTAGGSNEGNGGPWLMGLTSHFVLTSPSHSWFSLMFYQGFLGADYISEYCLPGLSSVSVESGRSFLS